MARDASSPESVFWALLSSVAILLAGVFTLVFTLVGWMFESIGDALKKPLPELPEIEPPKIELANTAQLVEETALLAKAAEFPSTDNFTGAFARRTLRTLVEQGLPVRSERMLQGLLGPALYLYDNESLDKPPSPLLGIVEGTIEAARFNDKLISRRKKLLNPQKTISVILDTFDAALTPLLRLLPPSAFAADEEEDDVPSSATVPILDFIPNVADHVRNLVTRFSSSDVVELDLFAELRKKLRENEDAFTKGGRVKAPDGTPREIVKAYLGDTALESIFDLQIPFEIPSSRLLEHAVVIAGSGHGKTQTLGALIARHLEQDDPPALVVVDSTGALVKRIQTLAVFNGRLKDRIVIIDPEHDPVPALNMFDVTNPRLQSYSQSVRDEVETEIVSLFNYIFTSAQNDLTSRQGTVFSYVVRLVLSLPGSTIHTLRQVLEEDPRGGYANSRYRADIEKLDETTRDFFKNQYFELKGFREQIAQRVYGLIQVPAFQRMFSTTNRIDFYEELQTRGSIILVNTSERLLKENASPLFGRYIIARTLASVFERAAIPEKDRRPTFLIVDEAAPYFDDTFDRLLTRVRQFKLGVCLAFQHMEQASEKLRSSIASNTSVKLAGGLGYNDSRWLSREMETTPEFIKAQERDNADPPRWTRLACYVRNFTRTAISLTIPFYALENMRQMTETEYGAMLERNRARVSSPAPEVKPSPPPASQSPGKADPDAASDWA
jgi:hypothetical protein